MITKAGNQQEITEIQKEPHTLRRASVCEYCIADCSDQAMTDEDLSSEHSEQGIYVG